jgi:hypothetical protein
MLTIALLIGLGLFAAAPRESGARTTSVAAVVLWAVAAAFGYLVTFFATRVFAKGNVTAVQFSMSLLGMNVMTSFVAIVALVVLFFACARTVAHFGAIFPVWLAVLACALRVVRMILTPLISWVADRFMSAGPLGHWLGRLLSLGATACVVAVFLLTLRVMATRPAAGP